LKEICWPHVENLFLTTDVFTWSRHNKRIDVLQGALTMRGRAEAQLIFAGEALGLHVSASHFSIGGIRYW
jgi:hypothetical protein